MKPSLGQDKDSAHPISVPKGPPPFLSFVLPLASALQTTASRHGSSLPFPHSLRAAINWHEKSKIKHVCFEEGQTNPRPGQQSIFKKSRVYLELPFGWKIVGPCWRIDLGACRMTSGTEWSWHGTYPVGSSKTNIHATSNFRGGHQIQPPPSEGVFACLSGGLRSPPLVS